MRNEETRRVLSRVLRVRMLPKATEQENEDEDQEQTDGKKGRSTAKDVGKTSKGSRDHGSAFDLDLVLNHMHTSAKTRDNTQNSH
jgi:hypothetical protein